MSDADRIVQAINGLVVVFGVAASGVCVVLTVGFGMIRDEIRKLREGKRDN